MIGIYGGAFNPVHNGHINVALTCQHAFDFDSLLIMPTLYSETKLNLIDAGHRLAMLRLCFTMPNILIDDREILRQSTTYTIDTIREVREQLGGSEPLCFIMGIDAFITFDQWEGWEEILTQTHLIIVNRPDFEEWADQLSPQLYSYWARYRCDSVQEICEHSSGLIIVQDIEPLAISSTNIREKCHIGKHEKIKDFVPPEVLYYMKQHQLYERV
jgi:nicotinate-nucleotide adenylyltransferase